jgi:hypothetical protein
VLGSRRERTGWSETATYRTTQQSRIVNMGSFSRMVKVSGAPRSYGLMNRYEKPRWRHSTLRLGKPATWGRAPGSGRSVVLTSRNSAGNTVRTLCGAGGEREPDDPGGTASRHGEGPLLESRVRLTSHARFGGEDGETGRQAPRPVLTQRGRATRQAFFRSGCWWRVARRSPRALCGLIRESVGGLGSNAFARCREDFLVHAALPPRHRSSYPAAASAAALRKARASAASARSVESSFTAARDRGSH